VDLLDQLTLVGEVGILVGASSRDVRQTVTVELECEGNAVHS
jgi:hypothetical protein